MSSEPKIVPPAPTKKKDKKEKEKKQKAEDAEKKAQILKRHKAAVESHTKVGFTFHLTSL